jgi:hypothetical protein
VPVIKQVANLIKMIESEKALDGRKAELECERARDTKI